MRGTLASSSLRPSQNQPKELYKLMNFLCDNKTNFHVRVYVIFISESMSGLAAKDKYEISLEYI